MADYRGALPQPTPETQPYWDGLRQHTLRLPYCAACQAYTFYPRPFCARCFSWDIVWRECSGRGVVHTFVINHRPAPGFEDRAPYVIAVIELEEGPRLMSNLLLDVPPTPDTVRVGMPVQIVYADVTPAVTLPQFRPVAGGRRA